MKVRKINQCIWCKSENLNIFAYRPDGVPIQKCGNCLLVMNAEIPENPTDYYHETYFNALEADDAKGYEGAHFLVSPAFLFWQNSFIKSVNEGGDKKRFLEIGAATGNLLDILKENQPNLDLFGIDVSEYAVNVSRGKGLSVERAFIEKYKAKPPMDIIFSSETMEHLDDLKSFLKGVADNMVEDGVFLFYVPSISEKDAELEKDNYVRFNVNMEHLLHFSPEFFQTELPKFFNAHVLIKEFKTSYGPSIIGAVSKNQNNIEKLEVLVKACETNIITAKSSDAFVKNLAVFSLKFSLFELFGKSYAELERRKALNKKELSLLNGLASYHKGELEKAKGSFTEYMRESPGSQVATLLLLANEIELNKLANEEKQVYIKEIGEVGKKLASLDEELIELKHSKLVGNALKLRRLLGKIINPLRNQKKNLKSRTYHLLRKIIPPIIRRPLGYILKLKWLIKTQVIENIKYPSSDPLVTIVIPYYNRGDTIDETIQSLTHQTYKNFEVIIVDDGSTDDESIRKFKDLNLYELKAYKIKQQNQGVAAARNNGIKKGKGKYIICLDSDDMLDPTYIEKCLVLIETSSEYQLATTDMRFFGLDNFIYKQSPYDPTRLLEDNMVVTAAMYTKAAWEASGGYKPNIGYEDWEYWINLAEQGFWGRNITEPLFHYRTAPVSRYTEDLSKHNKNLGKILGLHPDYHKNIKKIKRKKYFNREVLAADTLYNNLSDPLHYKTPNNQKPNILMAIPWMTFGGAETLIHNYCREIKNNYNISYITGLHAEHEWEYKFREITNNIYHLAHMFDDDRMYLDFISNYIRTRDISVLHVIHNSFMFKMLPELRKRYPNLKIAVTMFNDRVEHFEKSIDAEASIDAFISDNEAVATNYKSKLPGSKNVAIIPNGIDSQRIFNPILFNKTSSRATLNIRPEDVSVFFIGRLSVEKNPDVFVRVADDLLKKDNSGRLKFFIIGDGPMRSKIEGMVESAGNPNLRYLGYQSDIAKYLSAADIFVLPSSIEGFPLSILEAMAMRVAVVASDVGAVSDVIETGENGFVAPPSSTDDFKRVINMLSEDAELLDSVKNNARDKIETKYSNKVLGDNYKKFYKELLK